MAAAFGFFGSFKFRKQKKEHATILEICIDSVKSLKRAQESGCHRVELCTSLVEGGLTPSFGLIKLVKKSAQVPVHVLIRPRGGDFFYNENEIEQMLINIKLCKNLGVSGVVLGCLTKDGHVCTNTLMKFMNASKSLEVTFHRAIDMAKNPIQEISTLSRFGVHRILTSGGKQNAWEGREIIKEMVLEGEKFGIQIAAGGGLNLKNVIPLIKATGLSEIHGTFRCKENSQMTFRKENVYMGGTKINDLETEFSIKRTDGEIVSHVRKLLH